MEGTTADKKLFFDEFEIDPTSRRLKKNDSVVSLKSKAFDILLTLAESRGEIRSKSDLMDIIWADQYVEENNLTVHIAALRKALGEKKDDHRFIVTVPGQGYKFVGELREGNGHDYLIETHTVSRIVVEEESVERTAAGKWRLGNRWAVATIAIIVIAGLSIGAYSWANLRGRSASGFQAGSIKRLTASGHIWHAAALSPDGKLFAYALKGSDKESLWVGHVDGGNDLQILPAAATVYTSLTFTPDGSTLYYTTTPDLETGSLYRVPVFGGAPEKINDWGLGSISFAPDGKNYAFIRADQTTGRRSLIVANIDNSEPRELATGDLKLEVNTAAWSPDGQAIAFGAAEPGKRDEIYVIDMSGGRFEPITTQGWSQISGITWLPSGDALVAVAQAIDSSRSQIWNVSPKSRTVARVLTDLNSYTHSVNVSADGRELLAVQTQVDSNIWVAQPDKVENAKQLTFGSIGRSEGMSGLNWTPDGRILYTAVSENNRTIWIMDADGGNQKQLVPSGGNNMYPVESADGRYIVFQSNRSGNSAIWRVNSDGSNLVKLTRDDVAGEPAISPNGEWVYYVGASQYIGPVYRMSIDGGEPVRLFAPLGNWPNVSPDGRWITCGYEINGNGKLAIVPAEGGEPVKLFEVPPEGIFRHGIQWSTDGKAIIYSDRGMGLWKQSLDKPAPEKVDGLAAERYYGFSWSPDGKYVAFTRGLEQGDLVLLSSGK